jgi:hypothetical protein
LKEELRSTPEILVNNSEDTTFEVIILIAGSKALATPLHMDLISRNQTSERTV